MKNLEVFQMRCLRRILGITLLDRMRNNVIRERCCNQPTIEEQIQQHRLRWFGHICRMKEKRFPYRALWKSRPNQWKIQRTAPKKTWIKQIQNDIKNKRLTLEQTKEITSNREKWRNFVHNIRGPIAPTTVYWLRRKLRP